jgi:copper resistance protein C
MTRNFLTVAAAIALALPGVAVAHSKLMSSSPAANATVAKPTKLTLTFSETFLAPMSGAELVMTGMPGMTDHAPMPIKGFKTAVEGKTMTLTFPRALPAGTYDLKWHIVGADQHKMEGGYSFKVK